MIKYLSSLKNVALKPNIVNNPPIHIQLEPTTKCNLNCITCNYREYVNNPSNLSFERFKEIIDAILPKKLTLSGVGEPFLNPALFDMVKYAKSKGISVNTSSNGTVISNLAEKIVESGLDLLKISIDSARKETYAKIRGFDLFEKVLKGVATLQETKKKVGASLPYTRFQFVIQQDNFQEMQKLVELAFEIGVDAINFQILELSHVAEKKEQLVGKMTLEALKKQLICAANKAADKNVITNLPVIINNLDMLWQKYLTSVPAKKQCILPWFSTYIDIEGNMRPCCAFALVFDCTNLGNIFSEGLDAAWNSKKYQNFRKAIKNGKRPYKICKNCIPQSLTDMMKLAKILPGFIKKG